MGAGPLCWDYNLHAGCHSSSDCRRNLERMESTGVHWGIPMQLARRGGLSGNPITQPGNIDGYVHAMLGWNIVETPNIPTRDAPFQNSGGRAHTYFDISPQWHDIDDLVHSAGDRAGFPADCPEVTREGGNFIGKMPNPAFDSADSLTKAQTTVDMIAKEDSKESPKQLGTCVVDPIRPAEVLDDVLGDFQLFDCAGDEEHLRAISDSTDDWVYPDVLPCRSVFTSTVKTGGETVLVGFGIPSIYQSLIGLIRIGGVGRWGIRLLTFRNGRMMS